MNNRVFALCCVAIMITCSSSLFASEYPTPCFQGEELQKVRDWEKQWVGKKITSATVDQVKEFLPQSYYDLLKNTEKWGEHWFTIVPYRFKDVSPGKKKFTNENRGKASIDSSRTLKNWEAGVPFPGSKNALEIAWNLKVITYGGSRGVDTNGFIVDGRLKYDLDTRFKMKTLKFTGRTDQPPVPAFSDNKKGIWSAYQMHQTAPPEMRNLRMMEVQYQDWQKPYDSWMWLPAIRRIRRRSTSERQDAQGGADFAAYDNDGWDGPIEINTYKYLGQKDLLVTRHQDPALLEHTPGDCLYNGTQRERIKLHVIEATNDDTNFMYTKMIWYIDPEDWQMLYSERYDRRGKLWKVMDAHANDPTGYQGAPVTGYIGSSMYDVQRTHSTISLGEFEYGAEYDTRMFTLQWLQKRGY